MPKARPRRMPPFRGGRGPKRRSPRPAPQLAVADAPVAVAVATGRPPVTLPATIQAGQLATVLEVGEVDLIRALIGLGLRVTINQTVDYETASLAAGELGIEVQPEQQAMPEVDESGDAVVPGKEILWTDEDDTK